MKCFSCPLKVLARTVLFFLIIIDREIGLHGLEHFSVKMEIAMQRRSRNKVGLSASILFLMIISAAPLFAAEYSHVYEFKEPQITTLSNGRQVLEMEGTWPKDDIIGAPILPVKTSKMFIPAKEKVVSIEIGYGTLKAIEGAYVIQHATTPYPLSHKGPFSVDEPDPDIYRKNAFHPSSKHRARKPQFLRGAQIVLVDLMPVLYNPVEGHLKYYQELEVRIKTERRKKPDWAMRFRNSPNDRKRILRTIENKNDFLNTYPASGQEQTPGTSSTAEGPFPTAGDRQYVVITTADLMGAFETLRIHRASAAGGGYTTHIEDIASIKTAYSGLDPAEKMRNFIKDMYTNYGTEYVVLGGDCDGVPEEHVIPTRGCYAVVGSYTDTNIPSDLYFGCLDGTWDGDGDGVWGELDDGEGGGDIDWESEVFVGRIPADNALEAKNQIDKIIAFETLSHPDKTLLVGEKLDSDPTWGGDRMDWVHSFMGETPKTELYDRDWANNSWPKSQLLSFINTDDQYHWINHLGHSNVTYNMRLSNSDAAGMTNSKYLLVYTQGCYSGSIDSRNSGGGYGSADCIGEALTNGHAAGGAFAYIGNSRYGWYNPGGYVQGASNLVHKEFVEAIFTDNITKLGEANQVSKTDLYFGSGLYRWIAFETNLLGCPATDLATRVCLIDGDCDDGLHCNGSETCNGGVCQSGTAPDCDDGVICTIDSCNEDTDLCDNVYNDSLCDDGEACTEDLCDLETGECVNIWPECGLDDGCCAPECGPEDPDCTCGDGYCAGAVNGEDCDTCPQDCDSGQGGGTCGACFKGVCNGECNPKKEGPDCADCAPSYCCGDGVCEGLEDSVSCEVDCGSPPACGDTHCDAAEDKCSCPDDCGSAPSTEADCSDGIDNDCDGPTDCDDPDCSTDSAELSCSNGIDDDCDGYVDCDDSDCDTDSVCTCLPKGSGCDSNSDCCSNKCRGNKCR
jgi:hypothetical protein